MLPHSFLVWQLVCLWLVSESQLLHADAVSVWRRRRRRMDGKDGRNMTKLYAYFEWIAEYKEEVPRVALKDIGGGNLVMQTRIHHEKSDLILKIPKRYMITSAGVKQTERGVRLIQLMTSAGTIDPAHFDQMLVLYELLVDKLNPDSSLRPYYETIPTELPEIPCAWSEEDIAQLQAAEIRDGITYQVNLIQNFRVVFAVVNPDAHLQYSQQEVLLHYNFINSRSGWLSGRNLAINCGDFNNHDDASPTVSLSYEDAHYVYWTANAALSSGTILTSDYGITSNMRAFLAFGFVMDDPEKDVVNVMIGDPSTVAPLMAPLSVMVSSRVNVMAALRKQVANQSELWMLENLSGNETTDSVHSVTSEKQHWVSLSLEKKMLLRLAKICKTHLNAFPTSYETDVGLLDLDANGTRPLSTNLRNAILYRRGKKRILWLYYTLATKALQLLTLSSEEDFHRAYNKCQKDCHDVIATYCSSIIYPLYVRSIAKTDESTSKHSGKAYVTTQAHLLPIQEI